MNEGLFSTHLRQMRRAYKARHDALLEAAAGLSGRIELQATDSGFHTVGFLADGADEEAVVAGAREKGIIVAQQSRYCVETVTSRGPGRDLGGVAARTGEARSATQVIMRITYAD